MIVASAAAHATGLPPNVLECAPTGQSITSSRAIVTPIGSPDAMPFRRDDDVGLHAGVLDRKHLSGAADARLHFVDNQQHAVRGGDRGKPLKKSRGGTTYPPSPWIGSTTIAATSSGDTRCVRI